MARIGIDFGTSYSTVSYVNPQTQEAVPIKFHGKEKIPTMLYFPEDGSAPFVGEKAYAMYDHCMNAGTSDQIDLILGGIVTGLKRNMSRDGRVAIPGGRALTYAEAISVFLKYIKSYAEKNCFEGENITDVCITYPVAFDETPFKKEILEEAARLSGFSVVRLLKEPVAAAMGYSGNRKIRNQGILIYDFGGGTFDVSFVKFDHNGEYLVLPPMGISDCGGENIDIALYEAWDKIVHNTYGRHISEYDNEVFQPVLKMDCMKEKEKMSSFGIFQSHILILPGGVVRLNPLTASQWDDIVSPWVEKTVMLTQQMITRVEAEEANGFSINKVILIGGSSRFPQVTEKLRQICPVEPVPVQDVDVAVANGAAIYVNTDNVQPHVCYCCYDGRELRTDQQFCIRCGRPNLRYNYCFDDL